MSRIKSYVLLNDSKHNTKVKAGSIVHDCLESDNGLVAYEEERSGAICKFVTSSDRGKQPGFVVPVCDLYTIQ